MKRVVIRVSKEDSSMVYALLEAYEGVAMVSTLQHQRGETSRDLELTVPQLQWPEWDQLLARLREELPDGVKFISEEVL